MTKHSITSIPKLKKNKKIKKAITQKNKVIAQLFSALIATNNNNNKTIFCLQEYKK